MEVAEIKSNQQHQMQFAFQLNQKMDMILDILRRNLKDAHPSTTEQNNDKSADIYVKLPVNNKENLDEIENKLNMYDRQPSFDCEFNKQRQNLVITYILIFRIIL